MDRRSDPGATHAGARICVLLNGGSGRQTGDAKTQIRAAFRERGHDADIRVLEKGSEITPAAQKALDERFDIIVAAGGDGTISAVASALNGTGTDMGIIPLGTFNYFARSLDIPTEIPGAVDLLLTGARRPVRVAAINDRIFLNNASLGAYPAILKTREDVYRRWGRSRVAAYWSVLVTLVTLRRPLRLTIETDGKASARRTPLVFAVNNAFQLDQIGLTGHDEIAAGRLALFVAPDSGRWGMVRHALSLAMGTATEHTDFEFLAADRIVIETRSRTRDVACDGERARMRTPFELTVIEGALSVIAPQSRAQDTR